MGWGGGGHLIPAGRGSQSEVYRILSPFDSCQVCSGYVDDLKNTDNAWVESVTKNFHDDTGEILGHFQLKVGLVIGLLSSYFTIPISSSVNHLVPNRWDRMYELCSHSTD